ncbi:hypothetical protein NKH77_47235 [Streptomyces sp. M19]
MFDGQQAPGWFATRLLGEFALMSSDESAVVAAGVALGDRFTLEDLTEVAGLDEDLVCQVARELVRQDLFRPADGACG